MANPFANLGSSLTFQPGQTPAGPRFPWLNIKVVGATLIVVVVVGGGLWWLLQKKGGGVPNPNSVTLEQSFAARERLKNTNQLIGITDEQTLRDLAITLRFTSLDEARTHLQSLRVAYIRATLMYMKNQQGSFPATLDGLPATYQESSASSDLVELQEELPIVDIFTGNPYPYTRTQSDFRLTYIMKECRSDGCAQSFGQNIFAVGTNTMTSDDFSLEQSHKTDGKLNLRLTEEERTRDTDGDGLSDYYETESYGTDPQKTDTDDDGLSDREELQKHFTDPKKPDSDGDGFTDSQEVANQFNPNGTGKWADGWSACIPLPADQTCDDYCASTDKVCADEGISTTGQAKKGQEAWSSLEACQTGQPASGSSFCVNPAALNGYGWRCFCR